MLHLNHIKKSFNKHEILKDVEYTFNNGQIYPILGGPGAGRTTLFECICGDLSIDAGKIVTQKRGGIFFAAKQSVLPMYITGYEFIRFLCGLCGDKGHPDDYLDKAHISEEVKDTMICDYSFEDKKKLQLATMFVQKPEVVLIDEPLDYCSNEYIDEYISILNSVKNDYTILVSTGLLKVAQKISQDIIVLNDGELNLITKETLGVPEVRKAVLDILGEIDNEIL